MTTEHQSLLKKRNLRKMLVWDLMRTSGKLEVDLKDWEIMCDKLGIVGASKPEDILSNCASIHHQSINDFRFALKLRPNFSYCSAYIKTDGCKTSTCGNLHCCLHFLFNECKYGSQCKFSHNLKDNHNILILWENFMEDLNNEQLVHILELKNLLPSRPLICKRYNSSGGCKFGSNCTCLHLCGFYINCECSYGKNCKRSHDLKDLKVQELLEKHGINVKQTCKAVLDDIKKQCQQNKERRESTSCDMSTEETNLPAKEQKQSSEKHLTDDSQLICTFYLRNKCLYKENCTKFHQPDHLPYHWQYQNNEGMWLDLLQNRDIERNYCICEDHVEILLDGIQVNLNLNDMTWTNPGGNHGKIRRLSTELQRDASKGLLFLTIWRWYWMEDGVWINYEAEDGYPSSEVIETVFQREPRSIIQFVSNQWNYKIDLEEMIQLNKHSGKLRHLRRRPDIFDEETKLPKSISNIVKKEENNASIQTMTASSGLDGYTMLDVLSVEFLEVQKIFSESVPMKTVKKIKNSKLLECFMMKKHSLRKESGIHWREKFLFYGTQHQSVNAICLQGFVNTDVPTSRSVCFAEDASFFLDDPNYDRMFLAKVIIGEFIEPSHIPPSTANSEKQVLSLDFNLKPSIYVICDNSQAYPEYLIEF